MACDLPCMSYMALYVISIHLVNSSSRSSPSTSSQHWKLNLSAGKVEPAEATSDSSKGTDGRSNESPEEISSRGPRLDGSMHGENYTLSPEEDSSGSYLQDSVYEDRMMQILFSKGLSEDDNWVVLAPASDEGGECFGRGSCSSQNQKNKKQRNGPTKKNTKDSQNTGTKSQKPLTCGENVNETVYDHLKGIAERHLHSHIPEPDVAVLFQTMGKSAEIDINDLEQKLRKTRKEVEKAGPGQIENTAQIYNLIGNFWRIKGNTQISIECFRKALSISPNNTSVLLNLSRVLLNLRYLEDAILLAWRSLRVHHQQKVEPPLSTSTMASSYSSTCCWLQHYTLGQALRELSEQDLSGDSAERSLHASQAAAHFLHTLKLNPNFTPAKLHLRELEARGYSSSGRGFGDSISSENIEEGKFPSLGGGDDDGICGGEDSGVTNLPSAVHLVLSVLGLAVGLLSGVCIFLGTKGGDNLDDCGNDSRSSLQGMSPSSSPSSSAQTSQQRHFNRAMAMRSMKLGVNRKAFALSRKNNGAGL